MKEQVVSHMGLGFRTNQEFILVARTRVYFGDGEVTAALNTVLPVCDRGCAHGRCPAAAAFLRQASLRVSLPHLQAPSQGKHF